jgi:hypothetical protein
MEVCKLPLEIWETSLYLLCWDLGHILAAWASEPKICKYYAVKPELMSVTKVSVDVLLVDLKTTTFRDVSVECGDDPHISMKATSKSVHLFPLGGPSCSPDPSSGMPSCHSSSVTPLGSISNSEGSPFLSHGPENVFTWWNPLSSCQVMSWSLISLQLVLLENQPPVRFLLVDELPKLQSCLELWRFAQALLYLGF